MTDIIEIKGILPGLNEYTDALKKSRGNWNAGAEMKKEMTELARLASLRCHKFTTPVDVSFVWKERDNRRDPDNVAFAKKFILDGMVKAGVIPNDSRKWIMRLTDEVITVKDDPGVSIMIRGKA